jgi:hypothetical protein
MENQRPAIEILEQAVNLLRSTPRASIFYLIGAIPFTLALLVFLNDMTLSPYAFDHLAEASLGLAALYVWKNTWQAIFAARLYQTLSPSETRPISIFRAFLIQCALQPAGLAFPLPFPWLTAFFRNVAMFTAIGAPNAIRTARRQALLWTGQTWTILSIVSLAFLLLFLNTMIAIFAIPQLARSFLGVEGDFARAGTGLLSPSTLAVALALAWIVIDPLLDAVFVLRCFYGESIATGEDLRAPLRKLAVTVALLLCLFVIVPHATAQTPATPTINPTELDHSIDQVIHSREFTWRTPHAPGTEPDGRWMGWIRSASNMVRNAWNAVWDAIRNWLNGNRQTQSEGHRAPVSRRMIESVVGLLAALIAGAAVIFFLRRRTPVTKAQAITTAAPAIDLSDESLTADQLPESSWLALADDLLAKGDCRFALRALHLAGLNYLGEHNLVSIRRWKSGLDYRRELERRSRAKPQIAPVFSNNVDLFELGWYGPRPVDRDMVKTFAARLTEIRNHAQH